ncbi:restriction endonuclease [Amycolatopsis sp. A133]|uniref:restriction endonuclease n=1 Tax=Amycolatopsis sp. A133 TaxID=3064472 RepID=UPI0027EBA9E5|nr:restriction endonuclease [Amycolatopsis sp. A133]MDQ7804603.1 restriction endonuclease [Amycolatopsis sp. A133]
MTSVDSHTAVPQLAAQRALYRGQASSIPALPGGKAVWLPLALELVKQVGDGRVVDLDTNAELSFDIGRIEPRQGGAAPKLTPATWREYYSFLRGLRLVESTAGKVHLTAAGLELQSNPTPERLSVILADRTRFFAEVLAIIAEEALTVDEVDDLLQARYGQSWRSKGNTRSRMDWQEVLGLIEAKGNRRWQITPAGRTLLDGRTIVTPEAFGDEPERVVEIPEPPAEVAALLADLDALNRAHESRSTYNIWVPSPPSKPNKVENLRIIINAVFEKIERDELFTFICQTFELKRSSVASMLPFMRASGILVEVGRGVFEATPAARAWVESGDDLNFIRILHANMRFVGEMIRAVENDATRNAVYAEAALFGLNIDKSRWIAGFLLNTGLIEESRYGSLRATPRGSALAAELPLADMPTTQGAPGSEVVVSRVVEEGQSPNLRETLVRLSREPHAGGEGSGRAFEKAVRDTFLALGFEARAVGGAGDTDVLVRWRDKDGVQSTAIIEAKSRASGSVTHTDVSDVAIETHKNRHRASLVAVVGPGFNGDTIKDMAAQKSWALLDAERLGTLADVSIEFGLRPCEVGRMFQVPNGLSDLEDLIADRQRELDVTSFLLAKLAEEASESGEAISARDISRDGRRTDLAPSVDEVVVAIDALLQMQIGALRLVDVADDPKFATYVLGDASAGAGQLRALAGAIERGVASVGRSGSVG